MAFALLAATALFTLLLSVSQVLGYSSVQGPGGLIGSVLFLAVICISASAVAFLVLRLRNFRVQNGVMTLVMPRRTVSGKRVRHVPLVDIVSAARISEPDADPGILVTLRDGTIFPVFDADLYAGGQAFLDKLVAVVAQRRAQGEDYIP
jgi:hypothetical protein